MKKKEITKTLDLQMKHLNSNVNKAYFTVNFIRKRKHVGKSIQLPFGMVRDKSNEKPIKLNPPLNYRKNVLFDHLPYFSHLENPVIKDVVRDGVVDNIALQKYL